MYIVPEVRRPLLRGVDRALASGRGSSPVTYYATLGHAVIIGEGGVQSYYMETVCNNK